MKLFEILLEKTIYDEMIDKEEYLNSDTKEIKNLFWINTICLLSAKNIAGVVYDIGDEINDIMIATNIAQKYDLLPKEFLYQFTKFVSMIKNNQKREITENDIRDVFKNLNINEPNIKPSEIIFTSINDFLNGNKTLENIRPLLIFFVRNYKASEEFKTYSRYFYTK